MREKHGLKVIVEFSGLDLDLKFSVGLVRFNFYTLTLVFVFIWLIPHFAKFLFLFFF